MADGFKKTNTQSSVRRKGTAADNAVRSRETTYVDSDFVTQILLIFSPVMTYSQVVQPRVERQRATTHNQLDRSVTFQYL